MASRTEEAIECRREEILGRLNYCYLRLKNQRLPKTEYDLSSIRWLLQSTIRKLEKLPLPDTEDIINVQLELCESLATLVPSIRDDFAPRLLRIATSLRSKKFESLCSITQ